MSPIHFKTFSELTLAELYSILKLRVDVFVVEQNCPYPELDSEDEEALHLFIEEEDEIASYLRLITNQPKTRIGRVVTLKKHRGKRLSSKLMAEAMRYIAVHFPNKPIILSAQEHLQRFYAQFGFEPVSAMYLEDDIPHVDMQYQRHCENF
ncbi:MAG: GNAT family N-acetyltransferase [Cyclobacteriaceae bacterium]|nr:GNAT family N-acetyltransferase [Cyclobacteriaceae bacterium]